MNDKIILTPAEAESLLADGDYVHNFANPGTNLLIGCDYDREDAIKALENAVEIELGGDECKRLKHPIAVWSSKTRLTFFEADMEKVEAFEAKLRGAAT